MIKKILHSKSGDGYVDVCIGIVAFIMALVVAINIFEFITLRVEMDQIADELIESATFAGEFSDDLYNTNEAMIDDYYYYDLEYGADKYFNTALGRVQLGDRMWIKVSVQTFIKGLGIRIPITLSVKKSGLSERYWK